MNQGPARIALIDCALFSWAGNRPGIYVAADAYGAAWKGANIYSSEDDGETWILRATVTSRAVIGAVVTSLGDAPDWRVSDPGASVTVRPIYPGAAFGSATMDELFDGANLAVVGEEVVQWRDAEVSGDGTWTLQGMLRGRLGTEGAVAGHAAGEAFVALPPRGPTFIPLELESLGRLVKVRAASLDALGSPGPAIGVVPTFGSLRPWAPVDVFGARNESNDLAVSWTRRTRLLGDLRSGDDAPLGEGSERYVLEIISGDSEGELLRMVSCDGPEATYTAAEQAADGLTPGGPVSLRICQVSNTVGRGRWAEAVV